MGYCILRCGLVLSLLGCLLSFQSIQAKATLISFSFKGTVTQISEFPAFTQFTIGDTFSGNYTFESTTISQPSATGNIFALEYEAITDLRFLIGAYEGQLESSTENKIVILNNPSEQPGRLDRYEFLTDITGQPLGIFTPGRIKILLTDDTSTVFDSTALPLAPPPLDQFSSADWRVVFCPQAPASGRCQLVAGNLTALSTATIPEPTTLALFAMGLVGMGFMLRRRRRST